MQSSKPKTFSPLAAAFWAVVGLVGLGVNLHSGWLILLGLLGPLVGLVLWLAYTLLWPE